MYIRIIGLGKEQRESRRVNLAQYKKRRLESGGRGGENGSGELNDEMNRVSEFEPKEIIKPTLFDVTPQEIVDLVREIRAGVRKKVPDYDSIKRDDFDKIQKLSNLYLQKAVARVFDLFGYRQTHLLRRVYGNWSYAVYGALKMSKLGWLKLVLGHTSTNTSRAYTSLLITPIVSVENKDLGVEVGSLIVDRDIMREEMTQMKAEMQTLHTFKNEPQIDATLYANFWDKQRKIWVTLRKCKRKGNRPCGESWRKNFRVGGGGVRGE